MSAAGLLSRRRVVALLQHVGVGGLSVLVDLVLLVVLRDGLDVPIAVATAVAFGASVVVNFALNRLVHHGSGAGGLAGHLWRYVVLLLANGAITVVVVSAAEGGGLPYLAAKVAVVVVTTGWNFVLYRRWVFAPRHVAGPALSGEH